MSGLCEYAILSCAAQVLHKPFYLGVISCRGKCFVALGGSNQSALKVTVKPVTNINSSKPFFFKHVHKYLGPQSTSAILYDDMMGTIITYVFNMYRFYWLPTWILQPRVMHETMIVTLQCYKMEWIYMKMRVWTWGSIELHREIIITNHTHLFEIFQTCACWIPETSQG